VVAPSANLFGQVSPTTKRAVLIELGHLLHDSDVVINGGNCQIGIESTIIDCTQVKPIILRHGAVTLEQIKIVLPDIQVASEHLRRDKSFSGKFQSHYSPNAKVYLNGVAQKGDGLIALSNFKTPRGAIRLAAPKNNDEFAKCLYEAFRKADSFRLNKIYVITPSGFGIARAINERLIKAAYKTFRG
jgi:L-threonylcarbamoyladenylate synthase